MRYLKKLVNSVLIYEAVALPFIVIIQSLTGYDFTAAYAVIGGGGAIELLLSAIIEITKAKESKRQISSTERTENK